MQVLDGPRDGCCFASACPCGWRMVVLVFRYAGGHSLCGVMWCYVNWMRWYDGYSSGQCTSVVQRFVKDNMGTASWRERLRPSSLYFLSHAIPSRLCLAYPIASLPSWMAMHDRAALPRVVIGSTAVHGSHRDDPGVLIGGARAWQRPTPACGECSYFAFRVAER